MMTYKEEKKMETYKKVEVLNPLTLRNTVGGELADIFEAHGINGYENMIKVKHLKSKEQLSDKIIKRSADILGAPHLIQYLTGFQKEYMEEKARHKDSYDKAKLAYRKLKKINPMLRNEFTNGYDRLDDILDFFGVDSEDEIFESLEKHTALFREQNNVNVTPINLHAWLRRGELDFNKLDLSDYSEQELMDWVDSRDWERHIEDVDYFKSLPETFSSFGVGLVFVHSLPNTVYGAVRWIKGKPLVQISDRDHNLASCWFTLFHELGHVIKHKNEETCEVEINITKAIQNQQEREANKFANEYLFNGDNLRKEIFRRKKEGEPMNANILSEEFGVSRLFTSYWLLKAQYEPKKQRRISIEFS